MLEIWWYLPKKTSQGHVLAVKKELTAPMFLNLFNFETERDTSRKHIRNSPDLQEIYEFDFC